METRSAGGDVTASRSARAGAQEVAKVVEPPPGKPAPAKPTTSSKPAAPRAVTTSACEPTDEWKKHRRADLQDLDDRVQRSDTLWRQEQPHLGPHPPPRDEGDRREVEGELHKLVSRIIVATDAEVIQIHRDHREPEIQSVLLGRFSALTDSAEVAQGRCARG